MWNSDCIFLQLGYFEPLYSFQLLMFNYILIVARMFLSSASSHFDGVKVVLVQYVVSTQKWNQEIQNMWQFQLIGLKQYSSNET